MDKEALFRLTCFVGVLGATLLWELVSPFRSRRESPIRHRGRNLAILVLDQALVRVLVPVVPVALAQVLNAKSWGLFSVFGSRGWSAVVLTVVLLDLMIYLQHVLFHHVPFLWRFHIVHHSDLELDATTGVRFHPVEILLSLALKLALVWTLGPPAVGVMAFEVLLNATSLFNHANARLPGWLERVVRWLLVTPDMHRVHHSAERDETDRNFGFNLPWWDRIFGTYQAQPRAGHEGVVLGVRDHQEPTALTFGRLLVLPFGDRRQVDDGPEESGKPEGRS